MKDNGFTEADIRTMYTEASKHVDMALAGLFDKRRIEAAANIGDTCGYEIKERWQRLLRHYEDVRLLALALLADVNDGG